MSSWKTYKLVKLLVSPVQAAKETWIFPDYATISDRLDFVQNLPQELFGSEDFGGKLSKFFEIEEVPEETWAPPPGMVNRIRNRIDYQCIGRKTFLVDELPPDLEETKN